MKRRALLAIGLAAAGSAWAVLGEPAPAASAPQRRAQALAAGVQVIESPSGDGGTIREYVAPSGIVFAVGWNTRFKPRLEALLGRYHAGYADAASAALRAPGLRRAALLQAPDLVVQSSGRLNAFSGRAIVPSLTPPGFDPGLAR